MQYIAKFQLLGEWQEPMTAIFKRRHRPNLLFFSVGTDLIIMEYRDTQGYKDHCIFFSILMNTFFHQKRPDVPGNGPSSCTHRHLSSIDTWMEGRVTGKDARQLLPVSYCKHQPFQVHCFCFVLDIHYFSFTKKKIYIIFRYILKAMHLEKKSMTYNLEQRELSITIVQFDFYKLTYSQTPQTTYLSKYKMLSSNRKHKYKRSVEVTHY